MGLASHQLARARLRPGTRQEDQGNRLFGNRGGGEGLRWGGTEQVLGENGYQDGEAHGLFVIRSHELPEVLHGLELRDLTGIAKNMEARLHSAGIHTVEALCAAPKQVLHGVWGGVLGNRLWHPLRGDVIPDLVSSRKSIGHSHVMPPDKRSPAKAWPILCKLLHKACERLRSHGLLTGSLTVQLAFLRGAS